VPLVKDSVKNSVKKTVKIMSLVLGFSICAHAQIQLDTLIQGQKKSVKVSLKSLKVAQTQFVDAIPQGIAVKNIHFPRKKSDPQELQFDYVTSTHQGQVYENITLIDAQDKLYPVVIQGFVRPVFEVFPQVLQVDSLQKSIDVFVFNALKSPFSVQVKTDSNQELTTQKSAVRLIKDAESGLRLATSSDDQKHVLSGEKLTIHFPQNSKKFPHFLILSSPEHSGAEFIIQLISK
jgi:hypothetical protein